MAKAASEYAQQLYELKIPLGVVLHTKEIFEAVPALAERFSDPTADLLKKHSIIDTVFPEGIRDFLKVLCDDDDIDKLDEIFSIFQNDEHKRRGDLHATLIYVTPPTEEQLAGIYDFILKKYDCPKEKLFFEQKKDPSIVSGFKLSVENDDYDWSAAGRIGQLKQKLDAAQISGSTQGIISLLKSEVSNFKLDARNQEVGTVCTVGDNIVTLEGLDHATYGEIIQFDSGAKGMVQDIRPDGIGCILFGDDSEIAEGCRALRTGRNAGIAVSNEILGRVVNALGAPIDGLDPFNATEYRPIEHKAPGVVTREEVNVPLQTGILAVDSMFPIGRGQRELIIGDRQTGKTALAVDTIINQKGQNVICIYVAIGQKASTIAQIIHTLKLHKAMDYSIVVSATASDPATLQYIAPYTGAAIGEYFMDQGKDVLIVYDDLSKHAQAYRAISLLLRHPPGREAYPGDVFYLHSRLLERACRRSEKYGGGSMTALPVIETQAGDLSAYIPTNVISITDGQIFLETELFHSGQRPAINVGLSVSRVGGKAQTKAMKKASGTLRIDLAQYREIASFTQFSSDLDDATRDLLAYGKLLYRLLVQPQYHPMPLHKQVILLCAAVHRVLLDVPLEKLESFKQDVVSYIESTYPSMVKELESSKTLTDEMENRILSAVKEFKSR